MAGQLKAWADRVRRDQAPFVLGGVVVAAAVAWGLLAPGPQDARVFAVGWDEPGLGLLTIAFGLAKTVAKWLLSALLLGVAIKLIRRPTGGASPVPDPAPAPVPLPVPEPEVAKSSEVAETLTAIYAMPDDRLAKLEARLDALANAVAADRVASQARKAPARKRATKKPATKGAK